MPLHVIYGLAILACVLRPSKIDGARQAAAVIKLPISRLCRACPAKRFIVRADSGFWRRPRRRDTCACKHQWPASQSDTPCRPAKHIQQLIQ